MNQETIFPEEVILVLCDDYDEAEWCYGIFIEYLCHIAREEFVSNDYCCEVVTDTNLRYLFIDMHYMRHLKFDEELVTAVGMEEFISDMDSFDPIYF